MGKAASAEQGKGRANQKTISMLTPCIGPVRYPDVRICSLLRCSVLAALIKVTLESGMNLLLFFAVG